MAMIRPIQKRILVEPIKQNAVTKGGIYIPEVADPSAKGLTKGRIIAIAEDCDIRRWRFKIGGIILFNKFAYTEIKMPAIESGQPDKVFLLIEESKIEACIDE